MYLTMQGLMLIRGRWKRISLRDQYYVRLEILQGRTKIPPSYQWVVSIGGAKGYLSEVLVPNEEWLLPMSEVQSVDPSSVLGLNLLEETTPPISVWVLYYLIGSYLADGIGLHHRAGY